MFEGNSNEVVEPAELVFSPEENAALWKKLASDEKLVEFVHSVRNKKDGLKPATWIGPTVADKNEGPRQAEYRYITNPAEEMDRKKAATRSQKPKRTGTKNGSASYAG